MKTYQITAILKDQKDSDQFNKTIADVGEVLKSQAIGERSLNFPIKGQRLGYFYRIEASLPEEKLKLLNQELQRMPEVLSYILKIQPKIVKVSQPQKLVEKAIAKASLDVLEKPAKPKPVMVGKEKEKEAVEAKERQKILDEKLKELLKE